MMRILLRVCLMSFILWSVQVFSIYDPDFKWKVIQTEHFDINYHQELETLAKKLSVIAEEVHWELLPYFDWEPKEKTQVVLVDNLDVSNGYATMFAYNEIGIFVTPPDNGLSSLNARTSDWLRSVFVHEYTHILQLDKVSGVPAWFRRVFGKIFLNFAPIIPLPVTATPSAFLPRWMIEGIAIQHESYRSGQIVREAREGRAHPENDFQNMMMRLQYERGYLPLETINNVEITTPFFGSLPYFYGAAFFNFLYQRYGEEKIKKLFEHTSNNFIPGIGLNNDFHAVFGKGMEGIWSEFLSYLRSYYGKQIAEIKQKPTVIGNLIDGQIIDKEGIYNGSAVLSGDDLYYISLDAKTPVRIVKMNLLSGVQEVVSEIDAFSFDVHPQRGILATQLVVHRERNVYSDIFHVDPKTKRTKRLTKGGRYRYVQWMPSGERIIAVENRSGRSAIHILNQQGEFVESLWRGTADTSISHINVSPDGQQLVASVSELGSYNWNLKLFSLKTRQWSFLIRSQKVEKTPKFSQDGRSILFSANYEGVFNSYQYHLLDGSLKKLTHVVGGSFFPVLSQDNNVLVYSLARPDGFKLYKVDLQEDRPIEASIELEEGKNRPIEMPIESVKMATSSVIVEYSPWNTIGPNAWAPILISLKDSTVLGASVFGYDVLGRHTYSSKMSYDLDNDLIAGDLFYRYDRYIPTFSFLWKRSYDYDYDDDFENIEEINLQKQVFADVSRTFFGVDSVWTLGMGVKEISESDEDNDDSDKDQAIKGSLGFDYKPFRSGALSIDRDTGAFSGMLIVENSGYGGDYNGLFLQSKNAFYYNPNYRLSQRFKIDYYHGEEGTKAVEIEGAPANGILGFENAGMMGIEKSIVMRGYPRRQLSRNLLRASLTNTFSLARNNTGLKTWPLGVSQTFIAPFLDANYVDRIDDENFRGYSVGVEAIAHLNLAYSFLLKGTLGLVKGVSEEGEFQVYLSFGI